MTADLPALGLEDPGIGVKGFVGGEPLSGHGPQQGIGAGQIVRLSSSQQKCQRIAERVDQGVDLGTGPAAAMADRLILMFFWRASAVLMRPNDGAVDHRVFVVGVGGETPEDHLPGSRLGPPAEPPMCILPIAQALWEIAPGDPGPIG